MFELIALGVAGVFGHLKSKDWVRRKLRFTSVIEKPGLGLMAGAAAVIVAAPVVAVLPIVGTATALAIGAGVGTGVALGAREAREG